MAIKETNPTLIFSLLNLRKKIAATIAGIAIGAACLWGLAIWQDISPRELFNMFLAVVLMILVIILIAIAAITIIKLLWGMLKRATGNGASEEPRDPD